MVLGGGGRKGKVKKNLRVQKESVKNATDDDGLKLVE